MLPYCFPRLPVLINLADPLPGGRSMETLETSKHRPLPRYHFHPPTSYLRMDAQRNPDGIHQELPKHGQTYTRKFYPPVVDVTLSFS